MYFGDSILLPNNLHAIQGVQHAPVGILIVNEQGIIEFFNSAATKMFACRVEEVTGSRLTDWIPYVPANLHQQQIGGKQVAIRRNGTAFMVDVSVSTYRDEHGKSHHCLALRELKESEQELPGAERAWMLMELFAHTPLAFFILNAQGRISHVNALMENLSGYRADELLRTNPLRLVATEDMDRAIEHVIRTMRGEPQRYELAIRHKDGRMIRLKLTQFPLMENGRAIGVYGVAEDVTEQKSMEEALLRTQQGMIFAFREENGRFVHRLCDGELLYRLGLTPEAVVGKDLYEVFPVAEAERILPYYQRAWQGESVRFEGVGYNGITYLTSLTPIRRDGRVVEVVGSTVDISESKRKELELLETKELLESFINNSTDAINVLDVNGNVLRVNRAFETVFGWTEEELLGKPLPIIPPHLMAEYEELQETLRAGGNISGLETVRMRRDGSLVDVSISVSVIRDGKGRVIGSAAICRDITERKRTEELLRDSEKLSVLGQLAAGIAHEIRNPLTALKGFIQLLKSRSGSNLEYYDIMLSELERINFIVSELLVLARPQRVHFQPRDLTQMLKNVVTLLETQAIMRNVQINVSFDPDIPLITCEENHLKQVFINLLKNAIEAMPHGGLIQIQTEMIDPERVLIRVIDQGVGIPKERLPKLGEPFYTTKENGTGLGLMVCHRIIEAHQGTLAIQSELGVGTTVDVQLPVHAESGPIAEKS